MHYWNSCDWTCGGGFMMGFGMILNMAYPARANYCVSDVFEQPEQINKTT